MSIAYISTSFTVLFSSFPNRHEPYRKNDCRVAANSTVKIVQEIYDKARIPTLFSQKMAEEVEKLYVRMESLMKIRKRYWRIEGKSKQRIDNFKASLGKTMKFWPRNVMAKFKNEEDKKFLESMINDRTATMGRVDKKLSDTEKKVQKRREEEFKRMEKRVRIENAECSVVHLDNNSSSEEKAIPNEDLSDDSVSFSGPSRALSHQHLSITI